jgi:hypothetical protein
MKAGTLPLKGRFKAGPRPFKATKWLPSIPTQNPRFPLRHALCSGFSGGFTGTLSTPTPPRHLKSVRVRHWPAFFVPETGHARVIFGLLPSPDGIPKDCQ